MTRPADVVSVVIVNYDSADGLGTCLDALDADPDNEALTVIVVDNASGDRSADSADRNFARIATTLVRNDQNLGLAGAVNRVRGDIRTEKIAVLNPDTIAEPGWLRAMLEALDAHPGAAAASPMVVLASGEGVNSLGQRLHISGLGFNRLLGHPISDAPTNTHTVDGLHGAAFVIDTAVLAAIGGWNDTGFLYHEDVALSWSIRALGRSILAVPSARVSHDYYLSMHPQKLFLLERGRALLLHSHLATSTRVILSPLLAVASLSVLALCVLRGPAFIRAKFRVWRWMRTHRDEAAQWRAEVDDFRQVSDRTLLSGLAWGFPIRQIVGVGSESSAKMRRPLEQGESR